MVWNIPVTERNNSYFYYFIYSHLWKEGGDLQNKFFSLQILCELWEKHRYSTAMTLFTLL